MTAADLARVDADLFRSVLRRQAASVTVVTAAGDPPAGFTATSFTSVSLDPPLVSFCLGRDSSSWPTVDRAGHLAVHLLAEGQEEVARIFATSGIDRFATHTGWHCGPHDVPIIDGALAWLLCRPVQRIPAGDHTIVVAQPIVGRHDLDGDPLVYHAGRYASLAEEPGVNLL